MAGMLPGVEAARRRGFHRSHTNTDGATASRRPSFCLYVTNNHEFHFSSHSSLVLPSKQLSLSLSLIFWIMRLWSIDVEQNRRGAPRRERGAMMRCLMRRWEKLRKDWIRDYTANQEARGEEIHLLIKDLSWFIISPNFYENNIQYPLGSDLILIEETEKLG